MTLNDLPLERCHKVRFYPGIRAVYYDSVLRLFYKVWDPDYLYGSYFLAAYNNGFFKGLSQINSLICDQGVCRGYITPALERSFLSTEPHRNGTRLTEKIDPSFLSFCKQIFKRTQKYKFVYYDLTYDNVFKKDDSYFLVDLDSVVPKDALLNDNALKANVRKSLSFTPRNYEEEILKLIKTWGEK